MNRNLHTADASESIDLQDVFFQLWRRKIIIVISVIITLCLAIGYLFITKEKWTSSSIISEPDSSQVADYRNALNVLYPEATAQTTAQDIQQLFFSRFTSAVYALSAEMDNQEIQEELTIEPAIKGQALPLRVSYVSDSAKSAQEKLNRYMTSINQAVMKEIDGDLASNIASKRSDLQAALNSIEKVAQERKDEQLKQITQARKIAGESNITTPLQQTIDSISDNTMFILGSTALDSMIKNDATGPLPLSADYFVARQKLLATNGISSSSDARFAFRYVMKPNLPIRRDSPRRALTLIIATFMGGMIGAALVLGRNALRHYQPKTIAE